MKLTKWIGWSSVLCLSGSLLQAQDTNIADTFERKLKEMQESFQKAQQEMKENFEKKLNEQRQEIEALKKQLVQPATNSTNANAASEQKKLEQELAAELGTNQVSQATP